MFTNAQMQLSKRISGTLSVLMLLTEEKYLTVEDEDLVPKNLYRKTPFPGVLIYAQKCWGIQRTPTKRYPIHCCVRTKVP